MKTVNDNDNIRYVFNFMDKRGLTEEKQIIKDIGQYVDDSDLSYNDILKELASVKKELAEIKEASVKAKVTKIVVKADEKVNETKTQITSFRKRFASFTDKLADNIKKQGVVHFSKTMEQFKIQEHFVKVKEQQQASIQSLDESINKVSLMRNQLHTIAGESKNFVKTVMNDEPREIQPLKTNKGILGKIQTALSNMKKNKEEMLSKTNKRIEQLENLSIKAKNIEKGSQVDDLKGRVDNAKEEVKEKSSEKKPKAQKKEKSVVKKKPDLEKRKELAKAAVSKSKAASKSKTKEKAKKTTSKDKPKQKRKAKGKEL